MIFTVDVWFCGANDKLHKADWRRVIVTADNAVQAELVACQMTSRHGHAVASIVVDWD